MRHFQLFTPEDLAAVHAAAAEAEARTGGEVVAYVVGRCDPYFVARYRAAAGGALLAALTAGLLHAAGEYWGGWGPWWITTPVVLAALAGWGLALLWPSFERFLIGPALLARRVEQRALRAFVEAEVFATRDRTGVLLFLAAFEHRVVVRADKGLAAQVEPEAWERIAADLATGVRQGRAAAAMIGAIEACGKLMAERGVARRADDVDELRNELRMSDE